MCEGEAGESRGKPRCRRVHGVAIRLDMVLFFVLSLLVEASLSGVEGERASRERERDGNSAVDASRPENGVDEGV